MYRCIQTCNLVLDKLVDLFITCYHAYSAPEMDYLIFLTENAFRINRIQNANMFLRSTQYSVTISSFVESVKVSHKLIAYTDNAVRSYDEGSVMWGHIV
jgi:hypothetical protein